MTEIIATATVGTSLSARLAALNPQAAIPAQRTADAFRAYAELHKLSLDIAQERSARSVSAA